MGKPDLWRTACIAFAFCAAIAIASPARTPAAGNTLYGMSNPGGTVFSLSPSIRSFSPKFGPEGRSVLIAGQNLSEATSVTFGGVAATSFIVYSDTHIRATVPAGAKTGKIGVVTPAGNATSHFTFRVTYSLLRVTTTPLPSANLDVPYGTILQANGGTFPYTWSVTGSTGTCASNHLPYGLALNASTGLISGTPTQVGSCNFTVQVKDSGNPAATATANFSITVSLEYTDANLKGNYAFTFTAYKNGNLVIMAGAFVANGDGTFQTVQTSTLCGAAVPPSYTGCLDYNDGSGETGGNIPRPQFIVAATSNYSIGPNGLGTMVLVTDQGNTFNFHVSIISDGSGTLIEDNADPNERGSGVIKVQTSSDFKISSLNATFVVGLSGTDNLSKRYAGAGVFRITNGQGDIDCSIFNPLGCPVDVDDAGSLPATTFQGTFSTTVDTSVGRGLFVNLTFNRDHGKVYVYSYYVVSHNELILVSTNPINSLTPFPLTLGSARRQLTSAQGFDNTVLQGTSVMQLNAVDPNGGNPLAQGTVGLFTGDGAGNFAFNADVNDGGTSRQPQTSGTYAVNGGQTGTGRVQLTVSGGQPQPVLYMVAANQGFVVGTDPAVTSGYFEPQTGSRFSQVSIFGTYSGGTVNPVVSAVTDSVTWLYADGQGNINGTQDTSGPGGPAGPINFTWTYAVDSTGRAVVSGSYPSVMYVVSPTKVIMLPTSDTNPVLSVLKSAPGD